MPSREPWPVASSPLSEAPPGLLCDPSCAQALVSIAPLGRRYHPTLHGRQWGRERLDDLPKVTQLARGDPRAGDCEARVLA